MTRPKNYNPKCKAPLFSGKPCKYHTVESDGKYCKAHLYFDSYTEEMLVELHKCQRCKNMIHSQEKCDKCNLYHTRKKLKIEEIIEDEIIKDEIIEEEIIEDEIIEDDKSIESNNTNTPNSESPVNFDSKLCQATIFNKRSKKYTQCGHKHKIGELYCRIHENQSKEKEQMGLDNVIKCKKCSKILFEEDNDLCQVCLSRQERETNSKLNKKCQAKTLKRGETNLELCKPCKQSKEKESNYCKFHKYMDDYNKEMLDNLEICGYGSCNKLIYKTRDVDKCPTCVSSIEKKRQGKGKCQAKTKGGSECKDPVKSPNKRFCNKSHSYLEAFTDEQIQDMVQCSGCGKLFEPDSEKKTCTTCIERSTKNRDKEKETKSEKICKGVFLGGKPCIFKAQSNSDYCKNHSKQGETKDPNKKYCNIPYCNNEVDQEKFSKCLQHRERDRLAEQKRREAHKDNVEELKNSGVFICKNEKCKKEFEPFQNKLGKDSTKCPECYQTQAEKEKTRPYRKRNWKQELINNPERAKKIKERLKNIKKTNPEKFRKYWSDYRLRQRERLGEEEYKRIHNERMKKYRDENPEIIKDIRDKHYNENPKGRLSVYKQSSLRKGIEWLLTDDEAIELFNSPCFYCGYKNKKRLNGIDKLIFDGEYESNNSVPCCKHCNFMKGCLDIDIFIIRCMNIIEYNNIDEPEKDKWPIIPESSYDSISCNYNRYKSRAFEKGYMFELTQDEFNEIVSSPCYLCGKKNSKYHQNGIDRVDNLIGYLYDNCESCCSSCNYMKKDMSLDQFINHCHLIMLIHMNNIEYETVEFCNNYLDSTKLFQKQRPNKINDKEKLFAVLDNKKELARKKFMEEEIISDGENKDTREDEKEYFKNYRRKQRGKTSETTRQYNSRENWTEEDIRKYKAENKRQQRLRKKQPQ